MTELTRHITFIDHCNDWLPHGDQELECAKFDLS